MAGKKLQGQVAVITGAGRGIGAAAARLLAAAGASVVLVARGSEELDVVAQEITAGGGVAIAVPGDVSDAQAVEEIVESAIEQFGRVDILVNNAAVIWPLDPIAWADPDEWAYAIHTNLVGPFYMVRNMLPLMLDQGYGRIVNVTSHAAGIPIAGSSAYCASKSGLDMFTRTLALELAGKRVTVNGFIPGMVDTEMQAEIRSIDAEEAGLDTSYFHDAYEKGLLRTADDVARGIYWLVGPWGRNEHGTIFDADEAEWWAQVVADVG